MVCKTCGSQLTEHDKFCRYCGTTVEAAPQQSAPVYAPQPQSTYIPQAQPGYAPQPAAPKQPKTRGAHMKPSAPKKGGKKDAKPKSHIGSMFDLLTFSDV